MNIWLDCDPGIDDACTLAIIKANEDKLNLLGISAVAGNQTLDKTVRNALDVSDFVQLDAPVTRGADAPLVRPLKTAGKIHGENGLGNVQLPKSDRKAQEGIEHIAKALRESEDKVILCPTGPLTNIALLLKTFPDVKDKIEKIVLMGGTTRVGNTTPDAEFNIYVDPEAANIVFGSGLPVVMCGLDITAGCGFDKAQVKELEAGNAVSKFIGDMLDFYMSHVFQHKDTAAIHDACTVTYCLHPEWFDGEDTTVTVNQDGATVADLRPGHEPGNVKVLLKADHKKIVDFWMESLLGAR